MKVLTVTPNPALDLSVMTETWQRGQVNLANAIQTDAGGKGVNVAALLAEWYRRSGTEKQVVAATGLLGRENAQPFEELCAERNIADCFVRVPGRTRLGVKIAAANGDTTDFNLPGQEIAASSLQLLEQRLHELAPQAAAVVLAGSLPQGMPDNFYVGTVQWLRALEHRPLLAVDTSRAPLRLLLEAPTLPHILKPNIHELEAALNQSLPTTHERLAAATRLLERGAEWVALSLGAEGAYLVTASGVWHATPPSVEVQSTVGAGDAMVAGLVCAHLERLSPADALRRATAFSASNITRLGPHLAHLEELRSLEKQTKLRHFSPTLQEDV